MHSAHRLQLSRLYVLCLTGALLMCAVTVYAYWPFGSLLNTQGKPLGGDFGQFFFIGHAFQKDPVSMYDPSVQFKWLAEQFPGVPQNFFWPVWYPPFVGLLCMPFAFLSFGAAFSFFVLSNLALLAVCANWLSRTQPDNSPMSSMLTTSQIFLLLLGFPPTLEAIAGGQLSVILLFLLSASLYSLWKGKNVLAGALLALTLLKPNAMLLLVLALGAAIPEMLLGFAIVALGLLGLSWTILGSHGLDFYSQVIQRMLHSPHGTGTSAFKILGASSWFSRVWPADGRLMCFGLGVVLALILGSFYRKKLRQADFDKSDTLKRHLVCLSLCLNALFNLYTPTYDLAALSVIMVLLMPEIFQLLQKWGETKLDFALIFLFCAPHLCMIAAMTLGFQFFPIMLFGIAYGILRL